MRFQRRVTSTLGLVTFRINLVLVPLENTTHVTKLRTKQSHKQKRDRNVMGRDHHVSITPKRVLLIAFLTVYFAIVLQAGAGSCPCVIQLSIGEL